MRSRAVVLLYHRVVGRSSELLDYAPAGMSVPLPDFEEQMRYLSEHYEVIALPTLVARLRDGGALDDGLCCVTFDDGWLDNYENAFPILRTYRIPFTVFLTTRFIEGHAGWFWEERLKFILGHMAHRVGEGAVSGDEKRRLLEAVNGLGVTGVLDVSLPQLRWRLTDLVNRLRRANEADRERVVAALEQLLLWPSLAEPRRFLNWDEIRQMRAAGASFGAHTVSHANLVRCGEAVARVEIGESRTTLERALSEATLFAYPYGKSTPEVRAWVGEGGFTAAFTTEPGVIGSGVDLMAINRVDIHQRCAVDLPYFACRALALGNAF